MREVVNFFAMVVMSAGIYGGIYFAYVKGQPVLAVLFLLIAFVIAGTNAYYEITIEKKEKRNRRTTRDYTANRRPVGKTWR